MPVTDPIADMLTRIRNAVRVRHDAVLMPASRMKLAIARILKDEGFIRDYDLVRSSGVQRTIRVHLQYGNRKDSYITGLKRVSKPGLRKYVTSREMPRGYGGRGASIVTTSQGVMTGREAMRRGIGGELLCYIW